MIYDKIKRNKNNIVDIKNKVLISFIKGPRIEILGSIEATYKVQFIDKKTNIVHFETELKTNHWAKSNLEYFTEWKILITENGETFYEEDYDATDKRIYIAIDSKALGDSLAWISYVEEFGRVHKSKMIVSTFHNHMFENQYPNIEFVKPGSEVPNLYAMYSLGLFYKEDGSSNNFKNPIDPKTVTMQKMATDILGLPHREIKPKLENRNVEKDDKLITIAIHGTAQPKYWNNPQGWQDVVDWLNNKGYVVKLLSKENSGYMGNEHPTGIIKHPDGPLESVMDEMAKSKAFIGIGSGLSWLSWALGTKTVLISGFSYDWAEMDDCVRIGAPQGKCSGCFNRLKLDASDWNWCPDHKGTNRQYECTKSITSEMVINELEKFL
jgi:autotransporter strand-loop-strand O-heptosyltransferase